MPTKYVIVEQINFGRNYRAKPGLSFATEAEAKVHIETTYDEKRRRRFRVESRAVKDVDASQTMHCQCCGRAIHAALGTIAHHGYQRPGDGWQTASCFGARRLPWEVDRGALADLIDHLKRTRQRSIAAREGVQAGTIPVTHYYQVYDRQRSRYESRMLSMTRDTFDEVVRANVDDVFKHSYQPKFDEYKARDLDGRDRAIEQLRKDIKEFTVRYDGWKQTHKWNGKLWEAL